MLGLRCARQRRTATIAVLAMAPCACTLLTPLSGYTGDVVPIDAAPIDAAPREVARDAPDVDGADAGVDGGGLQRCPCSLFGVGVPDASLADDGQPLELGVRFTSDVPAKALGVRFYRQEADTGTHTGTLWSGLGTVLATDTFVNESPVGWQTLTFPVPVPISANTSYIVSFHSETGRYALTDAFFARGWDVPPLHATADNGLFTYTDGGAVPTERFNFANYWVDIVITTE